MNVGRTRALLQSFGRIAAGTVIAVVVIALPAAGQTDRGSFRGIVEDPDGAPVPNALVTLTHPATGGARTVETSSTGEFTFAALRPGTYRLEAGQTGFRTFVTERELRVNQAQRVDIRFELGSITEEVTVNAPTVPIDRDSPAIGTVIDSRQIDGLPLDGRNFLELSLLVPGTASAPEGSASSLRGDFAFSVNGGREDAQNFLLDGVSNVDPKLNTPGVRPPVDAIREFEVVTGNYDASFGRNSAGQVNVVTQSGSNAFNGSAWGFFRTEALDARNYFAPPGEDVPDFSRGQYGIALGGPVSSDELFFFADYERTRRSEGVTRVTNVPTLAERSGDFSQSLLPAPVNPLTGQPFDGGTIPSFFIHPAGQAIANLYPLPNRSAPSANFVSSPTLEDTVDHFDVRLDRVFGGGSSLTGRYSFSDQRFFEPFASAVSVPGYGTDVDRRGQNAVLGLTHAFSPTLINETRFGFTRVAIGVFHQNQGTSVNATVGLPELSSDPRDFGLSEISVSGFSPIGDEFTSPQESGADTYQILETLSWTRGAHLVEAGGEYRYVRQNGYRDVQSRGFLNFTNFYVTRNALADLLMGLPTVTGGATLDNPQRLRSHSWAAFVQDSYRVHPNLTLTAGLRYEYIGPAFDAVDRANLYDPSTGALVPVGTAGMPRGGYERDLNNIAPRLGIAWSPDGDRTVLRGGYGIYYNQGALATGEGLYFSEPYFDFNLYIPAPGIDPVMVHDPFPSNYPIDVPNSATAYQRDLRTPWAEHWSVSLQRQLGPTRAVEAAYVGSRGHDLVGGRDINQAAPSTAPQNLRPNPFFQDITFIESRARSDYDALQVKFQQRFEGNLSILASYTLSDAKDDASGLFASAGDPNFPQDSRNPELEYGRSSYDVRHRFASSFAWEMPFGSGQRWLDAGGIAAAIFGNFQLQGIVTLESGAPFTVALLPEIDNSNTGRSTLGFGANDRPNVSGDPTLEDPTAERWFDTAAFSMPAFGTFGNTGRNTLEGPGHANVNLALLKDIALGESATLQLRAESFNILNSTNFDLPDGFLGSPTFGQVTSAGDPRRCQFGIKLIF